MEESFTPQQLVNRKRTYTEGADNKLLTRVLRNELGKDGEKTDKTLRNLVGIDDLSYNFDLRELGKDYELRANPALYSDETFRKYWKSRNKHRPAGAPEIEYAAITDVDGDGNDDNVAYYVDGSGKKHLMGFNQHYLTDKGDSEAKYLHDYYATDLEYRKKNSYANYLRDTEHVDGYVDPEKFAKRQADAKSKPAYLLKMILLTSKTYQTDFKYHVDVQKYANAWFKCIKKAFFDPETPKEIVNYLLSKGGLTQYYKDFVIRFYNKIMANTENFAAFINDVINLLRSGAKDHIVEIMRSFTVPSEYYLTADDAKKLFAQLVVNKTEPKIRPTKSYEDAYNTAKSKFFINPDKQANTYYTDDKYGSKGFDLRGE